MNTSVEYQNAVKLYEMDWSLEWDALDKALWKYWKIHSVGETQNPDILLLLREPPQMYVIRQRDVETLISHYLLYLVGGNINLCSGDILLQGLFDGTTRVSLAILLLQLDNIELSSKDRLVLDMLPTQQRDLLFSTLDSFKKWLTSQFSKNKITNQFEIQPPVEIGDVSRITSSQDIISSEKRILAQMLDRARRSLNHMEAQAVGLGTLHVPAHLMIEIEDKRAEIEKIEAKIKMLRDKK